MPVTVLGLGLILLMGGLGTFIYGLSLTPTDMGRTWLVVGAALLSGSGVVLALGFGVQAILAALEARAGKGQAPVEQAPREEFPVPEPLVAAHEPPALPLGGGASPVADEGSSLAPETPRRGLRLPGMAALGGAVLGAGGALLATNRKAEAATSTESPDIPAEPPRFEAGEPEVAEVRVDEFEKDLFEATSDVSTRREPVFSDEATSTLPPLPDLVLRPEMPEDRPAPRNLDDEETEEQPALRGEAEELPLAEPVSVPGLIADDDLAALASEEPPLAPLETLEVVGAYDSGGVRFTMYSDGSVNAVGPHAERRYRTLDALRRQLDSGEPAV